MAEFHSLSGGLPPIPDNLTIPQFFFSDNNPLRPVRRNAVPWLIDDETGSTLDHVQVRFALIHSIYTPLSFVLCSSFERRVVWPMQ